SSSGDFALSSRRVTLVTLSSMEEAIQGKSGCKSG
ncbi:MAG: hypothetical protein ACI93G_000673, partial [Hyphomonas sp.]